MIIFSLDGTLADCEHRRHLVDPNKNEDVNYDSSMNNYTGGWEKNGKVWQPDGPAFYEACDKDEPISSVKTIINKFHGYDYYQTMDDVQIWSGRCESVRNKTEDWLDKNGITYYKLKMRPVGDNTPDYELKERWLLDEMILEGKTIDFVFDSDPKSIEMWRRRGIFVFDCNQTGREF